MVYFRKQRNVFTQRTEDAWKVLQSPWKKQFVKLSLSKEPDLVLPPVWLCRYLYISLLVFFFLSFYLSFSFFFLIERISLYLFHYVVMCCFVELRRALCWKIKRILFVCTLFDFWMTQWTSRWNFPSSNYVDM